MAKYFSKTLEPLHIVGRNAATLQKSVVVFQKVKHNFTIWLVIPLLKYTK